MNTHQIVGVIFIFVLQLAMPLLFICLIGFKKSRSQFNFLLKLLVTWTYFMYFYFTGQWGFVPYLLRYMFLLLMIAATVKGFLWFRELKFWEKKNVWGWIGLPLQLLLVTLFFLGCREVVGGFSAEEKGIDIAFPLKEGYVGHGGNSVLINYHHADTTAQQYALDISKLNGWGMRAKGLFPQALEAYAIYGDTLFSPCDGMIRVAKDGLPNFPPGSEDTVNLAGNHIILEYQDHLIVFAHLLKETLIVSAGDTVVKGQPLARIGNSGHTTEPHLHIHAIEGTDTSKIIRRGNGIPIYFDGKFLVRNDRFKMQ
jgi:hypothetical protein